jgi:2TM family of unknown function (DUF5676)
MSTRRILITGAAVATTTALVNIVCAIAVVFYPDAVQQLANSWAHGIDLTAIRRAPQNPLTLGNWAWGLLTSVVFAFAIGVLYRSTAEALERMSAALHTPLRASPER